MGIHRKRVEFAFQRGIHEKAWNSRKRRGIHRDGVESTKQRGIGRRVLGDVRRNAIGHYQRTNKRPRRATPVKERAAKVGVELPPTPAGVRDAIASDSPNTCKEGKRLRLLQRNRHQKSLQQRVQREEERANARDEAPVMAHGTRRGSTALRYYHRARQDSPQPLRGLGSSYLSLLRPTRT